MAGIKDPTEIAQRIRWLADSLTDPDDVELARRYAGELESTAALRSGMMFREPTRGSTDGDDSVSRILSKTS